MSYKRLKKYCVIFLIFMFIPFMKVMGLVEGEWEYGLYSTGGMYVGTPYAGTAIIKKYTGSEKNIVIPDTIAGKTVTTVSTGAFKDNSKIVSVTIPEGVLSLDKSVFNNNSNLTTVTLPSTIKEITSSFYTNCPKLTNINLPDNLELMPNGTYRSVEYVSYDAIYNYDASFEAFEATNRFREQKGLKPLEMNYELNEAAMKRAQELALHFDHTRPSGLNSGTILYNVASAENIFYAGGYSTGTSAVNAWINSDGHRKQMENADYKSIGIGYVVVNKQTFAVQIFSFQNSKNQTVKSGTKTVTDDIMISELYDCFYLEVLGLSKTINLEVGEKIQPTGVKLWNKPRSADFSSVRTNVDIKINEVLWTSSNNSIFSVRSGVVTARKTGTATLTAKIGSQELTFTVNVVEKVNATDIDISSVPETLNVGDEISLSNIKVLPDNVSDKTYTYEIANNTIVKISDGKLVGLKSGTTTVTFIAGDVRKNKTITVKDKGITSIIFDKYGITIDKGSSEVLTVSYQPANLSTPNITWSSSDSDVVSVSGNGLKATLYGKKAGTATITARADNGLSTTCSVTIRDNGSIVIKGDVNNSGSVDLGDILKLLKIYFNSYKPTTDEKNILDMNDDGIIDLTDVLMLLKVYF